MKYDIEIYYPLSWSFDDMLYWLDGREWISTENCNHYILP